MLLGPPGGSLKCVGCILTSLGHFYFSDLANGREQKCVKRVLEGVQLYHHQHVKKEHKDITMFKQLDKHPMKGLYKILCCKS